MKGTNDERDGQRREGVRREREKDREIREEGKAMDKDRETKKRSEGGKAADKDRDKERS